MPSRVGPLGVHTVTEARHVVSEYFVCLDTENWERMTELWHPDASLRAVGARPRSGRDAVIEYFSRLFRPWPQHRDVPTRIVVAGDVVIAEVRFEGITPGGRSVTFEAVDVFDLDAGRIHALSNWYDIDFVRRTLAEDDAVPPAP
jgi:ketosteroid isomerase-like protein